MGGVQEVGERWAGPRSGRERGEAHWSGRERVMCVNIVAHLNSREVINCQKVVAMAQDEDYHSLCPPHVVKDSTFDGGGRVLDHLLHIQQTANDG